MLPDLLPAIDARPQAWNIGPAASHHRTRLDSLAMPTDKKVRGWPAGRAAALRFASSCSWGCARMAGPGEEIASGAGGRSHLRASHADREQVIDMLKAAFVQGRLTKAELDRRVGQVLASLTYADLAALTADIPAGPAGAQPLEPARESDWAASWVLGAQIVQFGMDAQPVRPQRVSGANVRSAVAGPGSFRPSVQIARMVAGRGGRWSRRPRACWAPRVCAGCARRGR